MTDRIKKLSKTLEWYARDTDSPRLRAALHDAADALADRDPLDDEAEQLISEAYR
jgi:hypothetical protein